MALLKTLKKVLARRQTKQAQKQDIIRKQNNRKQINLILQDLQ